MRHADLLQQSRAQDGVFLVQRLSRVGKATSNGSGKAILPLCRRCKPVHGNRLTLTRWPNTRPLPAKLTARMSFFILRGVPRLPCNMSTTSIRVTVRTQLIHPPGTVQSMMIRRSSKATTSAARSLVQAVLEDPKPYPDLNRCKWKNR